MYSVVCVYGWYMYVCMRVGVVFVYQVVCVHVCVYGVVCACVYGVVCVHVCTG